MQPQVLKSWKEIAAYVKVGVSTAQRWERNLEFPVRRPGGKRGSAIVALSSEIDDWLKTHVSMQERRDPPLTSRSPGSHDDAEKVLEEAIITESLWNRPARPPDLNREIEAFRVLGREMMTQDPASILNCLIGQAITLCKADSAGISLLEREKSGDQIFRWVAATGAMGAYIGGTTPRNFSPCGICLERNCSQLFSHPERYYAYLNRVLPMAELLLIPLYAGNEGLGTLWVICHDAQRKFDREDARILGSLADFTAATLCALRLQQQRQEAEAMYRSLIQGIPNIVFTFDPDGNTNFVNEQWTVYTGMPSEQSMGWSWGAAVHPDDWPQCKRRRETALATGQIYETEYRLKRSDGLYRWHLVRAVPLKDGQGNIMKWFGTCTDIDEQEHPDLAFRQSRTGDQRRTRNHRPPRSEQHPPRSTINPNSKALR
jgi:PAS domain S-box-containing protein